MDRFVKINKNRLNFVHGHFHKLFIEIRFVFAVQMNRRDTWIFHSYQVFVFALTFVNYYIVVFVIFVGKLHDISLSDLRKFVQFVDVICPASFMDKSLVHVGCQSVGAFVHALFLFFEVIDYSLNHPIIKTTFFDFIDFTQNQSFYFLQGLSLLRHSGKNMRRIILHNLRTSTYILCQLLLVDVQID